MFSHWVWRYNRRNKIKAAKKKSEQKNLQKITSSSQAQSAHTYIVVCFPTELRLIQEQWNTLYAYNWFEYKFR